MKTNSIQRYANKEEIDQAYREIRAYIQQLESIPFFCSCLDLKFDRSKVSEVILDPFVSDFSTLEERRLEAFFSLVIKPQLFDREAEILKENLLFARCELPSFDWRGKRFPSIRIAAIHAGGAVVAWLLDYKHWLSEEWDRVSDCHVRDWIDDSFPISDADWDLLWDRWKLEYSRLLRDLPSLPVNRTDPTTTPKGTRGRKTDPEKEQKKVDLSYLRSEYFKWQNKQRESTSRSKFSPQDWFKVLDNDWTEHAREIFCKYSREIPDDEIDGETGLPIDGAGKLKRLLDLARKKPSK